MPAGYFDRETVEALTALRARALVDRREELISEFPIAEAAGKVDPSTVCALPVETLRGCGLSGMKAA